MTAESVLNSSACVSTMLRNVPVVVTGIHMGNVGLDLFQSELAHRIKAVAIISAGIEIRE